MATNLCKQKKRKTYAYFKILARWIESREDGGRRLYLHGDVCDGGGGQVEVLLDQDVELGGQVAAGADAVHLAGQQRRDLSGGKIL